jgi:hypothetical protein
MVNFGVKMVNFGVKMADFGVKMVDFGDFWGFCHSLTHCHPLFEPPLPPSHENRK